MKTVKIKFNTNNNIVISLDGNEKLVISEGKNIPLNAYKIFDIFDYKVGDHFKLEVEGMNEGNNKWASPFVDLIEKIIDRINQINIEDENTKDINLD